MDDFDLHIIMQHYCKNEYSINGDSPYSLDMITMHTGEKPTEEQLKAWFEHYKVWKPLKSLRMKLQDQDLSLNSQYLRAKRLKDEKELARIEQDSKDLDTLMKQIDIADDAISDFNNRNQSKKPLTLVVKEDGEVVKQQSKFDKVFNFFFPPSF